MADSLPTSVVGTNAKFFPLLPNWATLPNIDILLPRNMVNYPGTAQLMENTTDKYPIEFSLSFMVKDKQSEYELIDWIYSIKGRAKRFWIEHPVSAFRLLTGAASGASSITVQYNDFHKVTDGTERIFIAMTNGDIVARTVELVTTDVANDEQILSLNTPLDRELQLDNHWLIGRYLLCRLKEDAIGQEQHTTNVSTYSLGFTEVPYEIADLTLS